MKEQTLVKIKEFCSMFPPQKSDIDNANDLRRITNIAYEKYRNNEDVKEIAAKIENLLEQDGCHAATIIAKKVEKRINNILGTIYELDSLHLLK